MNLTTGTYVRKKARLTGGYLIPSRQLVSHHKRNDNAHSKSFSADRVKIGKVHEVVVIQLAVNLCIHDLFP